MEEQIEAEAHNNTEAEAEETAVSDPNADTVVLEQPDAQETQEIPHGAPEEYEDFIVPGQEQNTNGKDAGGLAGGLHEKSGENAELNVNIDPQIMGEFKERAKELNLSQENAQQMFDIGSKAVSRVYEQQMEAWGKTRERWQNELRSDNEFGGRRFDETLERANRALRKYGDDAWVGELTQTGFGDNAGLVRLLARVDKAFGEDSSVQGNNAPSNASREIGDSWYTRS